MKKLIYKFILFTSIFLFLVVFVTDKIFIKRKEYEKYFADFYSQTDSLDILFLGSSHAENTYNPILIDSMFLTNSYNLATSGQQLLVTNYLLKEILKTTKPKIVVIDIFPGSILEIKSPKQKGAQLRVFDFTKPSFSKIKAINKVYTFDELPSVYSETIRNHDIWHEGNWLLSSNSSINEFKGFIGLKGGLKPKEREKYSNYLEKYNTYLKIPSPKNQIKNFENNSLNIKETIEICKQNNIKLIFVTAPYLPSFYNDNINRKQLLLNEYLKKVNVEHLDFNLDFNYLGLSLKDFKDKGHLNLKGANKVTISLAKYLYEKSYFKIENQQYFSNQLKLITPRINIQLKEQNDLKNNSIIRQVNNVGITYDLNHSFNNIVTIESATFYIDGKNRYIILEHKSSLDNDLLNEYYFFLSGTIYKNDFNKRPKWNLGTGKDKLLWEVFPDRVLIDNKKYYILKLDWKCSIDRFKEFKIVMKNKETKKGIGRQILLKDIKIKN